MPYGQSPVVSPIRVASTEIAPRQVDGVPNGNIVTVRFDILSTYSAPEDFLKSGSIAYVLVLSNKYNGCKR